MFELMRRNNANHAVNRYNPFREMEDFERNFFGEPLGSLFDNRDFAAFRTDVTDEGDHFLLETDLPGFDKKDIRLDVSGNMLTVTAERHSRAEDKDERNKVIRMERSYGAYSRQFDITGIDVDGIRAKYDNGVLKLSLPKQSELLPEARTLEIE